VALIALPFAAAVNGELDATTRLDDSESGRVETVLREQFKSPFAQIALLRVAGVPPATTDPGRAVLERVVQALRRSPPVQGTLSYMDREDRLFVGQDGSALVIVGLRAPHGPNDDSMALLHGTTEGLQRDLAGQYPQLAFGWTGEAAVNADMRRISSEQTRTAELRVLPLTLLLLLIAFRSLPSAVLPVVCGGLTILVSLGVVALLNAFWPASVIVVSVISMVGLGLSIDYALLIVSRYRDARDEGSSHAQAVLVAVQRGARTVVVSGTAVAIGFAAMLLVRISEVRSIGAGGLVVTGVAVAVACTLLPILLSRIGPWLDRGRFPRVRSSGGRPWLRSWATWVTRHPWTVLIVAGAPLLLLAAQAAHLRGDLPRGRWLPEIAESVRVLHEIEGVSRGNFGQIIPVILELPPGTTIYDERGWQAASKLARSFARDPRVQHVWAATTLSTMPLSGPEILGRLPESVRRSFVSGDGRAALVQILPKTGLATTDAVTFVREIRSRGEASTGIDGAHLIVGGVPAFNVDYQDAIGGAFNIVALSVIAATLIVLALAFRSLLIPIKAVALNLLSVAASFGAVVLVFQDGYGSRLFGLQGPMDGGFPIVPILVFCIVFGLSMDYEVFIVARVADGRRSGLSEEQSLIEGLVTSGRVVSFAAAIMVVVFGSFVMGEFILIKILGFALSVAVILDATVVRLAVGPALIRLAGRWNWWPGP
jgi:RND superfamily putative drug exporter